MTEEKNDFEIISPGDDYEMEYRMMGNTGLQVSLLSYGVWATFGAVDSLSGDAAVEKCMALLDSARNFGVNLFDNAEAYGSSPGDAELMFGKALQRLGEADPVKWRRSDLVITTKIFFGGGGKNERGVSSKHLAEGLDASLARLQLNYVDIVFCHRPDPLTPIEETVRGMTRLIQSGKAFYWGTSEWSSQQITEAYWLARYHNLIPPTVEQPQYNMFVRDRVELEYQPVYDPPYGIGTTIWSPLASGVLTGKYLDGIPADSRLNGPGFEQSRKRLEVRNPVVARLKEYIENSPLSDYSTGIVAIAWCMKNSNVSTVLLGATKTYQLKENFVALDCARLMTDEIMAEIEEVLQNKPAEPASFGRALNTTI